MDSINRDKLRELVPERTYRHILRTVEKARELCESSGADTSVVLPAALLHDCAKTMQPTPEQEKELGDVMQYPFVVHAFFGAVIAAQVFGITDPRILDCIRYHTTGRPGMTIEEQVVFLADSIEDGRDYPGVEELRTIAAESVPAAVLEYLKRSAVHVVETGGKLHPLTTEAEKYFEMRETQGDKK